MTENLFAQRCFGDVRNKIQHLHEKATRSGQLSRAARDKHSAVARAVFRAMSAMRADTAEVDE